MPREALHHWMKIISICEDGETRGDLDKNYGGIEFCDWRNIAYEESRQNNPCGMGGSYDHYSGRPYYL